MTTYETVPPADHHPTHPGVDGLPAGLTSRPLTMADAPAVLALVTAEETTDRGSCDLVLDDVVGDWQRPGYDVGLSTIGVFAGPSGDGDPPATLLAYADLTSEETAYTAVHPDHRGIGIGTALAGWVQNLARSRGADQVGTQVLEGSPADRLMTGLGYRVRWTAWDLELPRGARIEAEPLPPGHHLRDSDTPADHTAAWTVIEDAFLEWADRRRHPRADFAALVWDRPGHQPWNLRLLLDGDEVVGATHVVLAGDIGYVSRIAVRPDHRGHGLARSMLADAFDGARRHGATRCCLATDTRAGARALYERAGMVVTSTWVNRTIVF